MSFHDLLYEQSHCMYRVYPKNHFYHRINFHRLFGAEEALPNKNVWLLA